MASDAEKVGVKRKSLASPKIVSKLSPINTFVNRNVVLGGTQGKNTLMMYAENKKNSNGAKSSNSNSTQDYDEEVKSVSVS